MNVSQPRALFVRLARAQVKRNDLSHHASSVDLLGKWRKRGGGGGGKARDALNWTGDSAITQFDNAWRHFAGMRERHRARERMNDSVRYWHTDKVMFMIINEVICNMCIYISSRTSPVIYAQLFCNYLLAQNMMFSERCASTRCCTCHLNLTAKLFKICHTKAKRSRIRIAFSFCGGICLGRL